MTTRRVFLSTAATLAATPLVAVAWPTTPAQSDELADLHLDGVMRVYAAMTRKQEVTGEHLRLLAAQVRLLRGHIKQRGLDKVFDSARRRFQQHDRINDGVEAFNARQVVVLQQRYDYRGVAFTLADDGVTLLKRSKAVKGLPTLDSFLRQDSAELERIAPAVDRRRGFVAASVPQLAADEVTVCISNSASGDCGGVAAWSACDGWSMLTMMMEATALMFAFIGAGELALVFTALALDNKFMGWFIAGCGV